jgi:DegV family protein with EDD domain
MIAIVTDSASMLPPAWRERAHVAIAPLTVVIDGVPYREGEDIANAEFYQRLSQGAEVSTSAPSPGDLLAIYEAAVDSGAASIVSIHTGSDYSAVLDAARIATRSVTVDVALVDTGTASFPVALCVASACDARDRDDDPSSVVAAAQATAAVVDSSPAVGDASAPPSPCPNRLPSSPSDPAASPITGPPSTSTTPSPAWLPTSTRSGSPNRYASVSATPTAPSSATA